MNCPKIKLSCNSWDYALKNSKRIKRCGCWQSESNVKANHQAYTRKCRKHKLFNTITGIIRDYKHDGFSLWRFKSFIKHDLI